MDLILDAATSATIAEAAHKYLEAGCSILPCKGKRPALAWDEFTKGRPSGNRVQMWISSGRMENIGLICGAISGGLVVIDVDSLDACAEFEAVFPALLDTLTVVSGSRRGKHYYYRVYGNLPANAWRNGVELRSDGAYVVAPPSVHPQSGLAYEVCVSTEPMRLPTLEPVRRWILSRGGGDTPLPAPSGPKPSHFGGVSSRYGRSALEGEAQAVALAAEGNTNTALYRAALKLGSLVASGHLTRGEVETTLESAAAHLSQRDGIGATRRTIQSAFKVSLNSPRSVR